MALIDRFFARAFKRGELTVIHPDGARRTFGAPDPDFAPVTIRLARGVTGAIMRNPGVGAAEAFMDGRLTIEQGDILGLLSMGKASNLWEGGATGRIRRRRRRWARCASASTAPTWRAGPNATSRITTT